MGPWWVRNARVYGRFVPTALWAGASLYDGLNPGATGASDMRFLDDPEIRAMDEMTQDRELVRMAVDYAVGHPARALVLAAVKMQRFWSPWPAAGEVRGPATIIMGALVNIPLYALIIAGVWALRRDARSLLLLAGPLVYVSALHAVFVGSLRYRIPVEVPAFGLAGAAWASWREGVFRRPGHG
jgi:hypothetical protein